MRRVAITMLAGAAAAAMPVLASQDRTKSAPQPKLTLSPQQFVAVRRVGMQLSAADIQLMRTAGEKGADIRPMSRAARSLSQWATALPDLFPAGTGPDVVQTRARAEIWSNRADFDQRARDFAAAASRLADAAAAGDMAAGREAWDATWFSCGGCHERYRSETSSSQ